MSISDWHPQDWILIFEAISRWEMSRNQTDHRSHRARLLQCDIAASHGFDSIVDFYEQIDDSYGCQSGSRFDR